MEFDLEQLTAITGGDPEFEREVLEEYLNCTPEDVERIRQAIAASDPEALGKAAHALKGSSATVGAKTLAALAKELEMLGKAGNVAPAPEVFGRLSRCYEESCGFIRQRMARAA